MRRLRPPRKATDFSGILKVVPVKDHPVTAGFARHAALIGGLDRQFRLTSSRFLLAISFSVASTKSSSSLRARAAHLQTGNYKLLTQYSLITPSCLRVAIVAAPWPSDGEG
jgi:hypothetical protein